MPFKSKEKREEWKKQYKELHGASSQTISHRRKKKWIMQKLGNKCSSCNYTKYREILVIHHKHGRKPEEGNKIPWMLSWKFIKNNISNWELLCPNCHAIKHLKDK